MAGVAIALVSPAIHAGETKDEIDVALDQELRLSEQVSKIVAAVKRFAGKNQGFKIEARLVEVDGTARETWLVLEGNIGEGKPVRGRLRLTVPEGFGLRGRKWKRTYEQHAPQARVPRSENMHLVDLLAQQLRRTEKVSEIVAAVDAFVSRSGRRDLTRFLKDDLVKAVAKADQENEIRQKAGENLELVAGHAWQPQRKGRGDHPAQKAKWNTKDPLFSHRIFKFEGSDKGLEIGAAMMEVNGKAQETWIFVEGKTRKGKPVRLEIAPADTVRLVAPERAGLLRLQREATHEWWLRPLQAHVKYLQPVRDRWLGRTGRFLRKLKGVLSGR
jgi:hypothetical protein